MSESNFDISFASSSEYNKSGEITDENKDQIVKSFAVRVSNLVFSYSRNNVVLNKCSINVPKGEIYALLGSNGCGKTTLINCIIGRFTPHSGHIQTFGLSLHSLSRNQIGYMPQHISLYNDFSIEENLRYFARIYGMNDKSITNKINEMLKLLDMPKKSRIVSSLSGGQQRRVSLCVALIHSPMLVILDEPTVGVDPVLRHQIWQYLVMICKQYSTTVIITTHYIEEARNASTVAYLRDGHILVEQNPEILLNKYNCDKLEKVFLILCESNGNYFVTEETVSEEKYEEKITDNLSINNKSLCENKIEVIIEDTLSSQTTKEPINQIQNLPQNVTKRQNASFALFLPLFLKSMLTFYRCQRSLNIFVILMSALPELFFYMFILKHDIKYPLSYHNNDALNQSTQYIDLLSNRYFIKREEYSEYSVIHSIIDGKSKVGISIPSNFTNDLRKMYIENDFTSLSDQSIEVYLELIDITDWNIIPQLIKTYANLIENYLSSNGLNPMAAHIPFEETIIYGNSGLNIFDFTVPNGLIIFLYVSTFIISIHSIVDEIELQVFERSIIAGVNCVSFYCAQLIAKIILLTLHIIIFMTILYPIFASSNLLVIYLLLFTQGLSGITLGFMFSSFIPNHLGAISASMAIIIIFTYIGGIIWPLEALPPTVQYLSTYLIPITLPIKSLHCILARDWSIDRYDVWIGFVYNIIYSIIYFIITVIYSHFSLFKN